MALEPFQSLDMPDPADKVGDWPTQFAAMFSPGLVGRTVMRFATATDRDNAIPSGDRVAGMVAWLTTPGLVTVHDGTRWLSRQTGGLWTRTTNQSVANNTLTLITWPTEVSDSDGFGTAGGNTLTVPAGMAGMYTVAAQVLGMGAPSTVRLSVAGLSLDVPGSSFSGNGWVTTTMELTAGQTAQVSVHQSSGGAVNVTGRFSISRVVF